MPSDCVCVHCQATVAGRTKTFTASDLFKWYEYVKPGHWDTLLPRVKAHKSHPDSAVPAQTVCARCVFWTVVVFARVVGWRCWTDLKRPAIGGRREARVLGESPFYTGSCFPQGPAMVTAFVATVAPLCYNTCDDNKLCNGIDFNRPGSMHFMIHVRRGSHYRWEQDMRKCPCLGSYCPNVTCQGSKIKRQVCDCALCNKGRLGFQGIKRVTAAGVMKPGLFNRQDVDGASADKTAMVVFLGVGCPVLTCRATHPIVTGSFARQSSKP